VLGACDDGLVEMYGKLGFEVLEQRIVEPRPGWRFRSHLLVLDTTAAAASSSSQAMTNLRVAA
jgi:hypothetical protein